MARIKPVPSLSDKGWITNPSEKLDALMAHWMESERGQTYIDATGVSNFQALKYQYNHDIPGMVAAIQRELETYFGRYFDSAIVDVRENSSEVLDGVVTIRIFAEVTSNGELYSMGAAVSGVNTKFHQWARLNNE